MKVSFVEVREEGVDPQDGIGVGRQIIKYDPAARDVCLVEVARALNFWQQHSARYQLQLLPDDIIKAITPHVRCRSSDLRCTYRLYDTDADKEGDEIQCNILTLPGGLAIFTRNVPKDALIQVRVSCGVGRAWVSNYQPVDFRHITLSQETQA